MFTCSLVVLFAYLSLVSVSAKSSPNSLSEVVSGCNQFSLNLHSQIHEPGANTFLSSYSICTAMAMVLAGATGITAEQLRNTFHYNTSQNLDPIFKKLIEDLTSTSNSEYTLNIANRIYGSKDLKIKPSYQKKLKNNYFSSLEEVDFIAGKAEEIINSWVSNKTHHKINELFPGGSFDGDTMLVLVSAIYFKGTWVTQFNPLNTKKTDFKISPQQSSHVEMMRIVSKFRYKIHRGLRAEVLHLPYSGDRLIMLIILPLKPFGLDDVMKRLRRYKIHSLLSVSEMRVDVKLPKFKLENGFDLTTAFKKLKSTAVFSDSANLSGISKTSLKISHVKHKAFIQVDETGTEASGATDADAKKKSSGPIFFADHPFYFAVVDKSIGLILFSGQMLDPTKSN